MHFKMMYTYTKLKIFSFFWGVLLMLMLGFLSFLCTSFWLTFFNEVPRNLRLTKVHNKMYFFYIAELLFVEVVDHKAQIEQVYSEILLVQSHQGVDLQDHLATKKP